MDSGAARNGRGSGLLVDRETGCSSHGSKGGIGGYWVSGSPVTRNDPTSFPLDERSAILNAEAGDLRSASELLHQSHGVQR